MIEWNNRWLIAGVSGTGKTWFALWLISQYVRRKKRSYFVFLSDNAKDYDKDNHSPAIKPRRNGFRLLTFDSDHARRSWDWKRVLQRHRRLYIETANLTNDEMTALVNDLSGAFWRLGSGLFAVDEAWQFLSHANPPIEYERLSRGGRKHGVDVMAITQRVVDIHPRILNSVNVVCSFRLTERNDVERVSRYFEPIGGRPPGAIIPTLRQGEYVIRATETGEQERNSTIGLR